MIKQGLLLKQQQKLSPQQIQLMKLLQVPTMELEQRIKDEMEINPALEEGSEEKEDDSNLDEQEDFSEENDDDNDVDLSEYFDEDDIPEYKTQIQNKGRDDDDRQLPIGQGSSFQEILIQQLSLFDLDEKTFQLADYLVGNLDDDGYLRRDLNSIVNDLMFSIGMECTLQDIQQALIHVQELDPAGVGARDLKECLLIQLKRHEKQDSDHALATKILQQYFEEFTKKHYEKIAAKIGINLNELKSAIELILHLNPKPGNSSVEITRGAQQITPDFILTHENEILKLNLNSKNAPELKISAGYKSMLAHYSGLKKKDTKTKEAIQFVKQKIDAAKWFIDAINQRNQTLLLCMEAIIDYQSEFFKSGDETLLKPMILKDVADKVNLDISTISRMANSKYIQTTFGTYLLKYFFSEGLTTDDGEEASSREIKQILKEAISNEPKSKPLPDEKLMALLQSKGYNIARRTVAKYREQLGIPVARLRKEL